MNYCDKKVHAHGGKYDRDEVIAAYKKYHVEGSFVFSDAHKLGISVTTLRTILKEAGIPFVKQPNKARRHK